MLVQWGPEITNDPELRDRANFKPYALGGTNNHNDNDNPKFWTLDSLMDLNGACAVFSSPPSRKTDITQDTLSSTSSRSTSRVENSTHSRRSSPQTQSVTCFPSASSSSRSTHVTGVRTSSTLPVGGWHSRLWACARSGRNLVYVNLVRDVRPELAEVGHFVPFQVRGSMSTDRPFCSTRSLIFVVTTRSLMKRSIELYRGSGPLPSFTFGRIVAFLCCVTFT
jgi:hypothetical protein